VALISGALVVAMPATAFARAHHRHHHSRIRHEHFGSANDTTSSSSDTAGTVSSFSGGVLTIQLNGGSTVSGMVTNETELGCESASTQTQTGDGDSGDDSSTDDSSSDDGGGDSSGEDAQMCTTANLIPGTVVQDAELNISSAGAVWHEVDLITP
jgi:hypothetical protein